MSIVESANPHLGVPVRLFAATTGLVLLTTCSLFVMPVTDPGPWWPWKITPFNARFLGAVYIAQTIDALLLFSLARWSPSRLILGMGVAFTAFATLTTWMHLDVFELSRPSAPFWFGFQIFTLLYQLILLWRYRRLSVVGSPPSPGWRTYLIVQAAILAVYGLAMLIIPRTAVGFWPWPVDDFHSRVYGAVFISGGVGAYLLARRAGFWDFVTIGVSHAAFGALTILGTMSVDAVLHRIDWLSVGTWLWVAFFAWLLIGNSVLAWHGIRLRAVQEA
jgi:hypothetical protein